MQTLRHYQSKAFDQCRVEVKAGNTAVLIVAPTGAGKTVLGCHLADMIVKKGNTVWVIVRLEELAGQFGEALTRNGVRYGVVMADARQTKSQVQICMAQTLVHRVFPLDPDFAVPLDPPDVIIIDEVHEGTMKETAQIRRIVSEFPDAVLFGLTATPQLLNGRGLGVSVGGLFTAIVEVSTPAELKAMGFLVPCRIVGSDETYDFSGVKITNGEYDSGEALKRVDTPDLVGKVYKNWKYHADGRPTIIFAQHRRHAHHIHEVFTGAGENFAYVDGDVPKVERRRIIREFKNGDLLGVVNIGLYIKGLDCARVSCIQQARKTNSLTIHLQTIGRGLRPMYAPGMPLDTDDDRHAAIKASEKKDCIVIDHGGNTEMHGPPDQDRKWTLEGRKRNEAANVISMKTCPICRAVVRSTIRICFSEKPNGEICGHVFIYVEAPAELPTTADGMLVEKDYNISPPLTKKQIAAQLLEEQRTFLHSCFQMQEFKGYKFKYALVKYRDKYGSWPRKKHGVKINWDLTGPYPVLKTWELDGVLIADKDGATP